MTEDEAEAALVAMGPQFEWEEYLPGRWWGAKGEIAYEVFTGDTGRTIAMRFTPTREKVYYRHKETGRMVTGTPAELRAACERHFATGKWE